MKLAIIICKDVTKICTGSGCMKAFNERTGAFEQYGDVELTLCAITDCLGCEAIEADNHPEFMKRLGQLKKIGVEKIHLGICIGEKYCKNSAVLFDLVRDYGFETELGTHA